MDQDLFKTEEQFLLLNNLNSTDKKCDFEVNFKKTINLQEPSESALIDIHLPNEIVVNTFKERRKLTLTVFWNFPIIRTETEKQISYNANRKYHDKMDQLVRTSSASYDYFLEPGITSLNGLLEKLETIEMEISEQFKLFYVRNYRHAEFIDGLNFFPPKLSYVNGKFRNIIGEIKYRGINNKWIAQEGFKDIDEYYLKKPVDFFKYTVVYGFINLDKELHEILGFDSNAFPIVVKNGYKLELKNNGFALNNFDLGWFNLIYIYTDIVKESYCGDTKANLLKVFSRKYSKNHIVPYHFNNLLYLPLRVSEINSIRILCADSFGETLTYLSGHISLTLVIRPIENV